jgi:cell division septal protein FtsQ
MMAQDNTNTAEKNAGIREAVQPSASQNRRKKTWRVAMKILVLVVLMPGSGSVAALLVWYALTTFGQNP